MPIYSNALAQRPANMLAYEDTLSATPRNPYLGALADLVAQSYAPQRTQQMQGISRFLSAPAISQTLDRLSYGEPLTTGAGMTTRIRPEAIEAGMAVAPMAQPVTMATLQAARAARQAALATRGLPVGMSTEAVGGMGFLRPQAPQEEALRLAQQRAALPIEQGGLGLPANNTPQQRAAAMGFDKDIYHGSQNEISRIDFSRAGQNTGNPNATLGFFTTPNPQEGSRYATLHGNQINANVMPLRAKSSNSYEMPYKELDDMAMSPYNLMMADPNFNPNAIVKFGDMAAQKAAAERLQKYNKAASEQSLQRKKELMQEGFDSATVLPGKSMEEFIVFNPDIIRSRFAAFDPFRKTAATAALMGVAAPDLLAAEQAQQDAYTQNEMRKFMRQGRQKK